MTPASTPVHLVFGATGQLGFELSRLLRGSRKVVALSRAETDFLKPGSIVASLQEYRPDVIWNAAAATAVDALESEPDLAYRVNSEAVGVLAESARKLGSVLVHFSTDYVFDGTKPGPYSEDDMPNPLNVYGASKLAGEHAVQQAGGIWYVLRTSWLYAGRGKNFPRAIARRGLESERLRVVNDQVGAPTEATQLARACEAMCQAAFDHAETDRRSGLYHLTASGSTSWWGFACAIRDELVSRGVAWKARIDPISTKELGLPARRPANSCLANARFTGAFGFRPLSWRDGLAELSAGPGRWWESA